MTLATVILYTEGENQRSVSLVYKQVMMDFHAEHFNDNNNWKNLNKTTDLKMICLMNHYHTVHNRMFCLNTFHGCFTSFL